MVSWRKIATYGKLSKRRHNRSSRIRRPCCRPCFMFYLHLLTRRRLLCLLHGIRRRLPCLLGIRWCPPVSPPRDLTAPPVSLPRDRMVLPPRDPAAPPCLFLGSDGASSSGSGGASVSLPRDPGVLPMYLARNPAVPPVSHPRDSAASLEFPIYVLERPAAAPSPAPVR